MGKATELDDRLSTRYLSPAEITARQAAIEIADDNVTPVLDDPMVKRANPAETTRTMQQAPPPIWD
jgi:hypothetical protein